MQRKVRKALCHPPIYTKQLKSWEEFPLWMPMTDACCILRKTDATVKRRIEAGCFRAKKDGGTWLIDRESLRAYLEGVNY